MAGVRLQVFIALVATTTVFSHAVAQVNEALPNDPLRDFGWRINPKDNVVEYVVQLSPESANYILQNGLERISDIPPELIGRATRVVVLVGDKVLQRSPSLEEIKSSVPLYMTASDVTASLGSGRFSDVDPNSVIPAQGAANDLLGSATRMPEFPQAPISPPNDVAPNGLPATGAGPGGVGDGNGLLGAGQALPATGAVPAQALGNASQRFLSDARAPQIPSTGLPNSGQAPSTSGLSALPQNNSSLLGSEKYQNTAPGNPGNQATAPGSGQLAGGPNNSLPGNQQWRSATGANPNVAQQMSSSSQGLYPQGTAAPRGAPEGLGRSFNSNIPPSLGSSNTFGQTPSPWASSPGFQNATNPGNGNMYAQPGSPNQGMQSQGMGYGSGQYSYGGTAGYGGGRFLNGQTSLAGYGQENGMNRGRQQQGVGSLGDGVDRVAANTNRSLPSDPPSANDVNSDHNGRQQSGSPSDDLGKNSSSSGSLPGRQSTGEIWLQIFFLVSLIVNFYLGMLIRKLLSRYRSLLSNVRGSTA